MKPRILYWKPANPKTLPSAWTQVV